ncbi:MAG: AAA family ATPase [Anaerolineaceae bacterium]|nr:AAA family ATPase [Anaerolineaceae bacterium]
MNDFPLLSIRCFGGLQFVLAEAAVTGFPSRKADALLVYLACHPRPHPRETLATLFWPDNDQTRALANLSVILTSLRKQLEKYLIADRHTVAFNTDADYQLDVIAFEQAIDQAQARQQNGKRTRTVAAQLQTAVSLYKGDFLAGFNLRGVPEFEAWVLLEQERLRQMMLDALSTLITFHQQRGQFSDGIQHGQRLLALDPLQEEAHRQLMLLYTLDNQRPAALAQYEQCAAILADELGVEPDEETTALFEQIKDDKVTRREDVTLSSPHLVTLSPGHNLPALTTTFIGRENELAQIEKWLAEPDARLLTIIGPGGMGKTRLAQEAARRQLGAFADGVWYVSLVPLVDDDELVTAVAETIGLTFAGNIDPTRQLISYLAGKEMLLILDNFEHLITDKSLTLLTDLMQQATELKLLVTSRERLNLQAEQLLELVGLPFPVIGDRLSVIGKRKTDNRLRITDYPAVELFANRARRLRADFSLMGQETAVAKLCQLVAGLPLALELAAAWCRTLTVAEIVSEIERGIDFLATNMRDLPERHRSVRAVFAYSWEQLTPTEKDAFSRLSVCRGGFSREQAQEIGGASLSVLSGLIDKSFIRLDAAENDKPPRYRRHPLLIQFAAEQLAQQPEKLAESQLRLAYYMAGALANRSKQFYGPERRSVMAFMTAEHENVRLAWQWAIENDPGLLEQLVTSYQYYLIGAGLFPEGYEQLQKALAVLSQPEDALVRALIQIHLCTFARVVGKTERGRELVLNSLAILDRLPTSAKSEAVEALALKIYGGLLFSDDSNFPEAKKVHRQALALFRQQKNRVAEGEVLFILSGIEFYTGQYSKAIQLAEESQAVQQQVGNQIGQMLAKQVLGLIYTAQGLYGRAIEFFHSCIALAEAANYRVDLPWHHANLGYAYLLAGQFEPASHTLQLSLRYSLEQGDPQAISVAYSILGFAHLHNGRFPEAASHGHQGIRYSHDDQMYHPLQKAFALCLLGAAALGQEQYRQAFEQLAEAVEIFREINHQEYLGWSLAHQVVAASALKRWRRAKEMAAETADLAQELDAVMPRLLTLTALAAWCCQQNQPEVGLALWAGAEQAELVKQSHWFQTITQHFIQPAAAHLTPEQRVQSQARGRSLNFEQLMALIPQ